MKRFLRNVFGPASFTAMPHVPRQRFHGERLTDVPLKIEESIDARPNDARLWSALGNAWLHVDSVDQAVDSFQRALTIDPNRADALNGLGNALREQGRQEDAIRLYQRAITSE